MAFVNFLENLTLHWTLLFFRIGTPRCKFLPISLQSFDFDSSLLQAPKTLQEFVTRYKKQKEIFDL